MFKKDVFQIQHSQVACRVIYIHIFVCILFIYNGCKLVVEEAKNERAFFGMVWGCFCAFRKLSYSTEKSSIKTRDWGCEVSSEEGGKWGGMGPLRRNKGQKRKGRETAQYHRLRRRRAPLQGERKSETTSDNFFLRALLPPQHQPTHKGTLEVTFKTFFWTGKRSVWFFSASCYFSSISPISASSPFVRFKCFAENLKLYIISLGHWNYSLLSFKYCPYQQG